MLGERLGLQVVDVTVVPLPVAKLQKRRDTEEDPARDLRFILSQSYALVFLFCLWWHWHVTTKLSSLFFVHVFFFFF